MTTAREKADGWCYDWTKADGSLTRKKALPDRLMEPLSWKKPRRVFVNSMSDLFHEDVPFEFVDRVFAVMALCPQHTFQVLTKRPERMAQYLLLSGGKVNGKTLEREGHVGLEAMGITFDAQAAGMKHVGRGVTLHRDGELVKWPLPNVWLGTSVEDQSRADERIPHLLRCPAAVRFLSCEPLIGPVDLKPMLYGGTDMSGVQWVIVGGESGANARACDVAWIRSIVKQCKESGVPVFVKQLGKWSAGTPHAPVHRWLFPDGATCTTPILRDTHWRDPPDGAIAWSLGGDPKGGKLSEWPEDLRVREWPEKTAE